MSVGPASALTAFGAALRRKTRYGALRWWTLAAATAVVTLSGVGVAVTVATYDGWTQRAEARSPRSVDYYTDEQPRLLWDSAQGDYLDDVKPVAIAYLSPLVEDAPLPPGLLRWPQPGEVYASPAMTASPSAREIVARYGSLAGTIEPPGLTDPGERLLYVRPADGSLSPERAVSASGFGTSYAPSLGAMSYQRPLLTFLAVQVALSGLPAGWLLVQAVRVGAGQRARRAHILALLGDDGRAVRRISWGEARLPVLCGLVAAAAMTAVAFGVDLSLPGARYTVQADDVRTHAVAVAAGFALGTLACVLTATSRIGLRGERARTRRVDKPAASGSIVLAAGPLVTAALTVIASNLLIAADQIELVMPIYLLGILLTIALLPAASVAWLSGWARRWRSRAWREGDPGSLTGAAQLASRPRPAARFGASAAVVVVGLALVYNASTALDSETRQALTYRAQVGNVVVPVAVRGGLLPDQNAAALAAVEEQYAVGEVQWSGTGTSRLIATQQTLDALGLSAGLADPAQLQPPTSSWVRAIFGGPATVSVDNPDASTATQLVVANSDGTDVDVDALQSLLARYTTPAWSVEPVGRSYVVGSLIAQDQARWLTWFGTIGLGLMLVALWTGHANELLRASRALAPVQVMAPDTSFVRAALAVRVVAPVAVVVVGGCLLALVLSIPMRGAGQSLTEAMPVGVLIGSGALTVLSGAVAWVLTARAASLHARYFRLGNPEE